MCLETELTPIANLNYVVEDPLGQDEQGDPVVVTTRRALCRLAFVAAETASRFGREGLAYDAMGWMLAPRRLFHGASALDACLGRAAFKRALLLHGLSIGLDADPRVLDDLDDDDGDYDDDDFEDDLDPVEGARASALHCRSAASEARLYSATFESDRSDRIHHGFHASTATSMGEFRARVAGIFGPEALTTAICREGINPQVRMIEELVAPELMASLLAAQHGRAGRKVRVTAERLLDLDS